MVWASQNFLCERVRFGCPVMDLPSLQETFRRRLAASRTLLHFLCSTGTPSTPKARFSENLNSNSLSPFSWHSDWFGMITEINLSLINSPHGWQSENSSQKYCSDLSSSCHW